MLETYLDALSTIVKGVPTTLYITFGGLILAFFLALTLTTIKSIAAKPFAKLVDLYVLLFSGTPLLFQYFIFYYSPTQFAFLEGTWVLELFSNTWFVAFLTCGLNSGAYTTIIFSGAIKNIDKGQWEVCRSMGLSKFQTYKLLFPYALRRVLPTYSNEVILLFKGTSLVSMITVTDIFGYAKNYYGETYDAITAFVSAGIIYLVISTILTLILRVVEKHWLKYAI
ncbi:arginine transporter permease subunit ArtM [Psittacicella hinzii]|uniref:Arginine ABC transporter permease protein ArtM n=1 Tax=Psittacicella hinzii TaxID=2028575 RepID=A0A3A1Y7D8_9GAMM|nr:ABC transporter permease subunit [Psittacicella hinzii]RIY33525.1 arginine transporter permease subunit ArtM [Psittacicella hinzii]